MAVLLLSSNAVLLLYSCCRPAAAKTGRGLTEHTVYSVAVLLPGSISRDTYLSASLTNSGEDLAIIFIRLFILSTVFA